MKSFCLSTDSQADILPEYAQVCGLSMIKCHITASAGGFDDFIADATDYAEQMSAASNADFVVKAPSRAEYEEYFDELAEHHTDIVHISVGSRFSRAYANALAAAKNTMVKFYNHNVYVIDSGAISAGLAYAVDHAVMLKGRSLRAEDAFVQLSELCETIEQYSITDDLSYYNRTHPSAAGDFAEKAGAMTLLSVDSNGVPFVYKKFPGFLSACRGILSGKKEIPSTAYVYGSTDITKLLRAVAALRKNGIQEIKMNSMSFSNCLLFGKNAVFVAFAGQRAVGLVKKKYSPGKPSDFFGQK